MGRAVLDHFLWQLDQCFELKPEHSLMGSLSFVTGAVLDTLPPGGGRTIRDLIGHCASVKRMHTNHAFGDRTLGWWDTWKGDGELADAKLADAKLADANLEALVEWLRRAHAEAQEALRSLANDEELLVERRTHWGELRETRLIVDAIMIHDVYHAGEINHLRGLLQNADQFPHGGRT